MRMAGLFGSVTWYFRRFLLGMGALGYTRAFLVVSPRGLVLVPRIWEVILIWFSAESAMAKMTSNEAVCYADWHIDEYLLDDASEVAHR